MPRERCLISFRLAGVCRTCKRASWPAHTAADLSIYCADCCEACRLDRAPLENPRAKAPGRRAIRSARPGKGGIAGRQKRGLFARILAPPAMPPESSRPKPPQGAKAGRWIADRPKTGSQRPLWRALLQCRGRRSRTWPWPRRGASRRPAASGAGRACAWRRACGLRQARSRPLRTCVSGRDFCLSGLRKRLPTRVWRGQNFFSGLSPFSSPLGFEWLSLSD